MHYNDYNLLSCIIINWFKFVFSLFQQCIANLQKVTMDNISFEWTWRNKKKDSYSNVVVDCSWRNKPTKVKFHQIMSTSLKHSTSVSSLASMDKGITEGLYSRFVFLRFSCPKLSVSALFRVVLSIFGRMLEKLEIKNWSILECVKSKYPIQVS